MWLQTVACKEHENHSLEKMSAFKHSKEHYNYNNSIQQLIKEIINLHRMLLDLPVVVILG